MDFWAGEEGYNYIRGVEHRKVMDSVYNYINKEDPQIKYNYNKLFLDNGAFSFLKNSKDKNELNVNLEKIINIQENFEPSYTVPFDYPLDPDMSSHKMEQNWQKTVENIEYWSDCTNLKLIPALHGWNKSSLKKNLSLLQKKSFKYIALGSTFILKSGFKGYFGDRQPSKNVYEAFLFIAAIAKHMNIDIHIFGIGSSPLTYHIAAYCEIKSSDSSGYRRKAAYGKIILPQTGERYAGNGTATFGVNLNKALKFKNLFSKQEKEKLANCECPVCIKISKHPYRRWKHLCSDWNLRAIHNKWVMEQEEIISKNLKSQGYDAYEKFIDKMMEKSQLKSLWNFVKEAKRIYF